MLKRIVSVVAFVVLASIVSGQDLFMPRDLQQAYKKGTRSADGNPGKNYWQNHARYRISVSALPPDRIVRGTETITYFNNSPDTLRSPTIKLFLNIHKPGAPRNYPASPDYLSSGMRVEKFTVNGATQRFPDGAAVFTNAVVRLPQPLAPHDSVQLAFDWQYEISLESGREGMIDSTTYFLAYFYPRIAVYDDYNGWDRMPFMDSHEFYSDFNDYIVTVNVPRNYLVWGTGTLLSPETLLQPAILKRYQDSWKADQTVRIVTGGDLASRHVTAQNAINSWTFVANNIPDMAFGLSNHYVWDGCSVVVDDATGRRASAQAAYNDTAADYHQVARYAQHSMNWLSHEWPGIPYPYEKTTVFQGYAGMEYPMMANDETYSDTIFSRFVAEHEIAHTYMPFMMGINETRYGCMDEGWATTFELLIGRNDLGNEQAEELYKNFRVDGWINDHSAEEQIPIITPGDALTGRGFGNNEYGKASLGYFAVKDILGEAIFRKCLHAYMNRWKGKHPTPWDFFYTFNNVAGRNLNWFWSNWFFSTGYIDFAIAAPGRQTGGYELTIQNKGGFFAPADLLITYSDGSTEKRHLSPGLWEKNPSTVKLKVVTAKKIHQLEIAGGIFMDSNPADNTWVAPAP